MKRIIYILLPVMTALNVCGCNRFLDREQESFIDLDKTYTSYERTSQALVNVYRFLPDGLNRIGAAMYDAATDDGENTIETCNIQKFNNGSWGPQDNPDDLWNQLYTGIRLSNEFIANVHRVDLENYKLDPDNQTEYKNRLKDLEIWKNEAIFLRAFFHFELVKRYGPVPYIDKVMPVAEDHSGVKRPEMDEVVNSIVADCDAAAAGLELTPWRDNASAYGRATKGAALALKSRVLLYAASPLWLDWKNSDESYLPSVKEKWEKAAAAAKEVIDLDQYMLFGSYSDLFQNNIDNREFIFQKRYANSVSFETVNSPVSYGGTGGTTPTLNLMEAYELKDGSKFAWDGSESAKHPFVWRDKRLAATFIFNGDIWKDSGVETFDGGKDASSKTNGSKTGFYLRKFMNESANVQTGGGASGHVWPYFRFAEIYLNYAEALNECDPGNSDIEAYLNKVRNRAGQPSVHGLGQEEMRELIRNERRVELAFEEHRAWDVRRWKIASKTLGADVRGLGIVKDATKSSAVIKSASIPSSEVPEGWYYYDGDEFGGSVIDNSYWGLYGADSPVGNQWYGQPNGNVQTYRSKQVSICKDGELSVCRVSATREDDPPAPQSAYGNGNRPGWWSGALSSRDTDKYGNAQKLYPLFSRFEIRMKTPYIYGIWMAPWCRYYAGAQYAELDIEEFFIKTWLDNPALGRADKYVLSQALHLHDNDKGQAVNESTLGVNVNGYGRHVDMPFNPYDDYHTYGVQVDPDPEAPTEHAIISYLLDGKVTNTFKTRDYGSRYNTFITKAIKEGHEKTAWDFAITGQIGGRDSNGIGYPEDKNPDLREISLYVDWVRVYTREQSHPDEIEKPNWPEKEGFTYGSRTVEKRTFEPKMYWYPIPESEILRTGWEQNPKWN